jgi:hypothetical protein
MKVTIEFEVADRNGLSGCISAFADLIATNGQVPKKQGTPLPLAVNGRNAGVVRMFRGGVADSALRAVNVELVEALQSAKHPGEFDEDGNFLKCVCHRCKNIDIALARATGQEAQT